MKKILAGLLFLLALPASAFAAYNDVSLTTDAVFTVNSVTLNVTGSADVVESAEVSDTTLTVTLQENSTLTVDAPEENRLALSGSNYTKSQTCTASDSSVTITGTAGGTGTVVITPSSTACPETGGNSAGGSGGGGYSGGGGGGGGSSSSTVTTPTTPAAPATQTSSANVSSLVSQLLSLIAQLKALGGTVSPSMEASIKALSGGAASAPAGTFVRDLQVGSTGDDVKALQVWLNANGYQVAASGAGSPGNETTMFGGATRAALIKFQKAKGITPAAGYFGPKTRATFGM
ncbi:peptidoglycan-binding protein [Candidatus Kaiserbacteria bacterium]|nr:peptidoglycan-binding protein [Candidatus Kaiserbacteria bacterium]